MASRTLSKLAPFRSTSFAPLALLLVVGACGEEKNGAEGNVPVEPSSSVDPSATTDQQPTGAPGTAVGPGTTTAPGETVSPMGPTGGGTGGTGGTGGAPTSTTDDDSSDTTAGPGGETSGGGTGPDDTATGEGPGDTTTSGDATDAGTSEDDDTSGGDGTTSEDPTSDGETTGPVSTECTRELLDGLLDDYFAALSAGDPSTLPLAANVKFTENAQVADIGSTAFWMNAGDTKHSQRALDTTQCSVAAQAVIPEGTTDLPIGIRIKVEAGEMTEIETIVVRPGDYRASFAVDSDPAAIIAIADDIGWHDEVPEGERATREELAAWIDKYFRAFPDGVCNVTDACIRLENGGGQAGRPKFSCREGAQCSASAPATGGTLEPRVIIVDEVRGIAAGFTNFEVFMQSGHLDMHMMKMSGGQVHAVHAILRDTNGQSGWD